MTPRNDPKYLQIAEELRAQILTGTLKNGDRLPSEAMLADRFQVAVMTARRALDLLRDEGLILRPLKSRAIVRKRPPVLVRSSLRYRRPGGPEPTSHFAAEVEAGAAQATWSSDTTRVPATEAVAKRLRVEAGELVTQTRYLYLADGCPMQTSVSWEPAALTAGTAVAEPEGEGRVLGVIARMHVIGIRVPQVVEIFVGRTATAEEREELEIPPDVAVWDVERTHYDEDGRPVETADLVLPQDRYKIVNVIQVP